MPYIWLPLPFPNYFILYVLKQIRIILKKFGMKFGKPFVNDYRRPANAEDILKKP